MSSSPGPSPSFPEPQPASTRSVTPSKSNAGSLHGLGAVLLGLSGCVGGWCCAPVTVVLGLGGIAMGLLGVQQARDHLTRALGIFGVGLSSLTLVLYLVVPIGLALLGSGVSVFQAHQMFEQIERAIEIEVPPASEPGAPSSQPDMP